MNIIMINEDINYCNELKFYLKSHGGFDVIKILDNSTDAINYIKNNKNILDLIMVDLELPNMSIESVLDVMPKNCNLLAVSDEQEKIEKYLNYPYIQRIFQKPISSSNILNYICIQNGIETLENVKKQMIQALSKIGFNISHSGSMYLVEAVALSLRNKIKKLSELYVLIANNHNTDPKLIGWSINNAINKATKTCDENVVLEFFKIDSLKKLTAKFIINFFTHTFFENNK